MLLFADKLGVDGTLSSLHRIHEGQFYFDNEKALNPFTHLALPSNLYTGEEEYMELGKKLSVDYFENKEEGIYLIETKHFFSIIEILDETVKYKFNRIPKFKENTCTA